MQAFRGIALALLPSSILLLCKAGLQWVYVIKHLLLNRLLHMDAWLCGFAAGLPAKRCYGRIGCCEAGSGS